MKRSLYDFRSDTVTKPTAAMREAMAQAEVGDDVFGEDPSIVALEQTVAALLGKEAALFVPSGTMANQLALHLHCRPGDTVLTEDGAHIFYYETGAAAALSGVQFDFLDPHRPYTAEHIASCIRRQDLTSAPTTLLSLENTHNRAAGRSLSPSAMNEAALAAKQLGLAVHCDGARLWNAAVAWGTDEKSFVGACDTVSVCFSKGLGAPVGSALCGNRELVARARRIRKRWGGGMRQAGIIAAGALYAVQHHRSLLARDHLLAAHLATGLQEIFGQGLTLRFPNPGSNIIFFKVAGWAGDEAQAWLHEQGVLLFHMGQDWLRLVTHLDVDETAVAYTLKVLTTWRRSHSH